VAIFGTASLLSMHVVLQEIMSEWLIEEFNLCWWSTGHFTSVQKSCVSEIHCAFPTRKSCLRHRRSWNLGLNISKLTLQFAWKCMELTFLFKVGKCTVLYIVSFISCKRIFSSEVLVWVDKQSFSWCLPQMPQSGQLQSHFLLRSSQVQTVACRVAVLTEALHRFSSLYR
jgi:hypothetical protein